MYIFFLSNEHKYYKGYSLRNATRHEGEAQLQQLQHCSRAALSGKQEAQRATMAHLSKIIKIF